MIINYADRAHACRSGYPVFTRVKINEYKEGLVLRL